MSAPGKAANQATTTVCVHLAFPSVLCRNRKEVDAIVAKVRVDLVDEQGSCECTDCHDRIPSAQAMLCLQCPARTILCGRYHKQDAIRHSSVTGHCITVNLSSKALWCYLCDKESYFEDNLDAFADEASNALASTSITSGKIKDTAQARFPSAIALFKRQQGFDDDESWTSFSNDAGGLTGLSNLGNTCFVNSGIQALIHVPQLIEIFAQKKFTRSGCPFITRQEKLVNDFSELVRKVWDGLYEVCVPRDIIRDIWALNSSFRGYDQQDSQEFLRCMINNLHEGMKHDIPKIASPSSSEALRPLHDRSLVSDLFSGTLLSEVKCNQCGNVSCVYDPFMDLSLEIPSKNQMKRIADDTGEFSSRPSMASGLFSSMMNWAGISSPLTLESCLYSFCSMETLVKLDQYKCDKCQKKVNASKVLSFGHCPEILSFHIKRFSHNSYWGSKLSNHIEFPLESLDLTPFIRRMLDDLPPIYHLTSLVKHMGSVNGGHYIAYARHHLSGQWYEFDDRQVNEVSEDTVRSQEAYVLIYNRTWTNRMQSQARANDEFFRKILSVEDESPRVYLSLFWLKRAEIFPDIGPIDNYSLCCAHGQPLPGSSIKNKALTVSMSSWKALHEKFSGGPMIMVDTLDPKLCLECLATRRITESRQIAQLDYDGDHSKGYYLISETWLSKWRKFCAGGELPGPIENHDLLGDDGGPLPALRPVDHYRGVDIAVWQEFQRLYGGGPAVFRQTVDIYEAIAN